MNDDLSLYDGLDAAGLGELEGNWPVGLLAAAYGYSRGARFSVLTAALFGVLGYMYPYVSSALFTLDAFVVQESPSKRFLGERIREAADRRIEKVRLREKAERRRVAA